MKIKSILLMTMVGVMFGAAQASAAVINVTMTGDDFGILAPQCSLREAVESINLGAIMPVSGCVVASGSFGIADEIVLVPGSTYTLSFGIIEDNNVAGDLDLKKDVIITGSSANPPTIDILGVDRVFHLVNTGLTVKFTGLIIQNGFELTNGGGIYISSDSDVTVTQSTLKNNSAVVDGGGIYASSNSIVTVDQTNLDVNDATTGNGGGIYQEAGATSTMRINNSTLDANIAGINGAGIYALGNVDIVGNSLLQLNIASVNGGGVYISGAGASLLLDNSVITRNNANTGNGGGVFNALGGLVEVMNGASINGNKSILGDGGGIYNFSAGIVEVTDSTIEANAADNDGGGIYNSGLDSSITLDNSLLKSNKTTTGDGGGIYNDDGGGASTPVILRNGTVVEANTGDNNGGGIYNKGPGATLTITDTTLTGNVSTTASGGAIANDGGTASLTDSFIDKSSGMPNTAFGSGGGIATFGGPFNITGSKIEFNEAPSGGGIATGIGTLTIDSSSINNNKATTTIGGGIANTLAGIVNITGSSLIGNSATTDGGGIYNFVLNSVVTITDTTLSGNTSGGNGGAICNDTDGVVNIIESTIDDSTSANTANYGGGIANINKGTVNITDSTIHGNTAIVNGGGIFNTVATSGLVVTTSTVSGNGNGAVNGGGISNESGANADISNSTISGNNVIGAGGGLYNSSAATMDLSSVTIANNTAGAQGFGLHVQGIGTNVNVENSILDNSAPNCTALLLGTITSIGFNLDIGNTCFTAPLATDLVAEVSALLAALANNGGLTFTHALTPTSPALDVGDSNGLATDQRGSARPKNLVDDIGAFEFTSDPVIAEVTQVPVLGMDTTPDYTFSSTKAGTIAYGGDCTSSTTAAVAGNNTVTFDTLGVGAHENCTIQVTDIDAGVSNLLDVSDFVIQAIPVVTGDQNKVAGGRKDPLTAPPTAAKTVQTEDVETAANDDDDEPEMRSSFFLDYFRDVASHWARRYIEEVREECFLTGYLRDDGTPIKMFRPDRGISRAEFMVMVIKCKDGKLAKTEKQLFFDLESSHWAAQYVRRAVEMGIIKGFDDGTFRPNGEVTRLEALVTILLTFYTKGDISTAEPNNGCSDVRSSDWYFDHYSFALNEGIIRDGRCGPNALATRAEIVEMLKKSM